MNRIIKTLSAMLFLSTLLFSQSISQNIQFTDMNGKSYDLFEMLGEGKHIYLQMMFNG